MISFQFILKQNFFFTIKIVQKLKTKKFYYINWKALPKRPHSGENIYESPLLVQAVYMRNEKDKLSFLL